MAKIAYNKLKLKLEDPVVTLSINPEVEIEVHQYLPIQEKLGLVGRVIEFAHQQDYNFFNPMKYDMIFWIEVVDAYTNITFTEKQKEDMPKLYDQLKYSGVLDSIIDKIPIAEISMLKEGADATLRALYEHQNSIAGMLETVSQDYSALDMDASEIQKKLADPNTLELVKGLLTKVN